jgi:hypothetical protein
MTLALHPLPQAAIPQSPLRAPLSSCFQLRVRDFVEMGDKEVRAMLRQNSRVRQGQFASAENTGDGGDLEVLQNEHIRTIAAGTPAVSTLTNFRGVGSTVPEAADQNGKISGRPASASA